MKILKSKLQDALKGLAKVVNPKAPIPVLKHARVKAVAGRVTITGTNLDEWLSYTIEDVESAQDADWLLEFVKLREFVNGGDGKTQITLEPAGESAVRISFDVAGHLVERAFETLAPEDWPNAPVIPEFKPVTAPLFDNIRLVLPSASKDASRKILNGAFLEKDAVIATDGKHMVKLFCEIPIEAPVIVPPTKVLTAGMLKDDGAVAVSAGEYRSVVHMASGPWIYSFKCTDGTYPNYRQTIPDVKLLKSAVEFPPAEMQALTKSLPVFEKGDSLDGVAMYAGTKGVKLLSTKKGSTAMLDTSATSTGEKEHGIAVFDRKYLLKAFSLGLTRISFDCKYSPLVAAGEKGLMVFMPIRGMISDEYWKRIGIETPKEEKVAMTEKTQTAAPQGSTAEKPDTEKKVVTPATSPTGTRETFKVVHGAANGTADPFDELQKAVTEIRNAAKTLADSMGGLQRKIAETQRAVKQREKDFRNTREILDKLKNASGF